MVPISVSSKQVSSECCLEARRPKALWEASPCNLKVKVCEPTYARVGGKLVNRWLVACSI